jgi:thioredoxin 1
MSFGNFIAGLVVAFVIMMLGMRVLIWAKVRAARGKPVPSVPGDVATRVRESGRGLVYFFSPSCGACRAWTPRLRELSNRSPDVHIVNVLEDLLLAQALGIMATPSTVEIEDGRVVDIHVGSIPGAVLARFAGAASAPPEGRA